ncbi:MAG: hypothetical protein M1821_006451 [Bathelium mastoideum]|nr:MAG: hypothetical protein M1821_006451 [Bathelium mastoideum]
MPRPSRAAGLPSSSRSSKDLKKYTVAIDFGTTTASCAYRPPSSQYPLQSTGQVKQILFDDRLFYTEVQATWLRSGRGRFCWGLDLRNKINSGEVSTEDVVKLPKLQLYDGLENEIIVKQERAKLERLGKTLDQLIVDLLFHLYECCRNSIKAQEGLTKLPVDPKCFEVLLCVPQDFSNLQTERISKLAIEAQIPQPRIVSEAECAASFHFQGVVDRCSQKMPISCGVGDVVLVGDAGGGTLDGGAFKFETNAQGGASTHLRPLRGRLFGHLCGSEFINQHFLDWLKDEWRGRISDTSTGEISASGDLVSLLPVLEIGLDHALGQASTDFESCKESWDPDNVRWSKTVTILGQDETRKIAVFLDA